jgi:hypothetical protein|tara:strand:+ start:914 stop:1177 length:264 start_codon:yes stop_codon:yes gene_type:complete
LKDILGLQTEELLKLVSKFAHFVFNTAKVALTIQIHRSLHKLLISSYLLYHYFPLWKIFGYFTGFFFENFHLAHLVPSLEESLFDEY